MAAAPRSSDWIAREPGLRTALHELGRFRRRAFARPALTLAITTLLVAAVVVKRARQQPGATSTIVFRVTEGDLDLATAPRPNARLRSFVSDVAFSTSQLEEVARRHGLYKAELKRSAVDAAEAFREDIGIQVWRNYFLEGRAADDPARSARVAISFAARDPALAYEVVQDLGRVVVEANRSDRLAIAHEAAARADLAADAAREELSRRRAELTAKELSARARPSAAARLELQDLRRGLEATEARMLARGGRKAEIDLRVGLEERSLGVQFQLVDSGRVERLQSGRAGALALLGVALFALLLPLVTIAVGAFDPRIYDGDDVRRLGLVMVGRVDGFSGDGRASLVERRGRAPRV